MLTMKKLATREAWLEARGRRIGGSDAAALLGLNPWKNNVELWEEKTGRREPEDIGDKPCVKYGNAAEPLIRHMYTLDRPDIRVIYEENNLWVDDGKPYAHASLDGWLVDMEGRRGILEIKTSTASSSAAAQKWKGGIPDNYYCQCLHYLMVTGWDFVDLRALIRYTDDYAAVRDYRIERADVLEDVAELEKAEKEFYKTLDSDTPPGLILPCI